MRGLGGARRLVGEQAGVAQAVQRERRQAGDVLGKDLEGIRDLEPLCPEEVELAPEGLVVRPQPASLLGQRLDLRSECGRALQALQGEPEQVLALLHPAYEVRGWIFNHGRVSYRKRPSISRPRKR